MKNAPKPLFSTLGFGSPWTCLVSVGLLGTFEGCVVMTWCSEVRESSAVWVGGSCWLWGSGWHRCQVQAVGGEASIQNWKAEHFAQVERSVFLKEMFCKAKTFIFKTEGYYWKLYFFLSCYEKKASTYFKHFKILSAVVFKSSITYTLLTVDLEEKQK